MSAIEYLGYLSIRRAAKKLGIEYRDLRQLIEIKVVPPPMRDIGGSRKYYSPSDIAEIQNTLSKGAA